MSIITDEAEGVGREFPVRLWGLIRYYLLVPWRWMRLTVHNSWGILNVVDIIWLRPMLPGILYLHGGVHYNGGWLLFNDFEDAIRHFSDPRFAAEFRRFVREERREPVTLFRERDYDREEFANFVCFMRTVFPWFSNSNGPKKFVLWGNPSPYPAVNTITGNWIRDCRALKTETGRQKVARPPICSGRYFGDGPYSGTRERARWPERLLAKLTEVRIRLRGDRVGIEGYEPQLLGETDEEAEEGLVRRMEELIVFSKGRGQRLVTPVLVGDRSGVEPVVLESAMETSRVTADVLHTLGVLAGKNQPAGAVVEGVVVSEVPLELRHFPAKVILLGTSFSTVTDLAGGFSFRQLPVGSYEFWVCRSGCGSATMKLELAAGPTNHLELVLPGRGGNYIRNGDFKLGWIEENAPDFWYRTSLGWEGEIIPLRLGQRYRLSVGFPRAHQFEGRGHLSPGFARGVAAFEDGAAEAAAGEFTAQSQAGRTRPNYQDIAHCSCRFG